MAVQFRLNKKNNESRYAKEQAKGLAMMRSGETKMDAAKLFRIGLLATPKTGPLPKAKGKRRIQILFLRQRGLCHLCGEVMSMANPGDRLKPRDANIDHYVPRSRGGSNAMSNLRAAHYECNHEKGSKFIQSCEPEPEITAF